MSSKNDITIIAPAKSWQLINIKEIFEFKDLLYFFVKRDITIVYKQTVLGFSWAILNPLLTMIVFTFAFGKLAKVSSDGLPYPLFAFAALVPWTYFSQALTLSTNSLVNSINLINKVYFPRIIIPLTPIIAKLVDFIIAFAILLVLMLIYGKIPGYQIIYIPYLILLMILTAFGIGLWLSAISIQFRDVRYAAPFLVQLLLFAAPVAWSLNAFDSNIVPKYGFWIKIIYGIYPMAGVVEGFRAALLGKQMPWDILLVGSISSLVLAVSGLFYFRKIEYKFADIG
jgi:lipopolysaccharide transport system permease protein